MDYKRAKEILATARDGRNKPLENNTRLEAREGGRIAVRLHDTDVLTIAPDDSVTYQTGGWRTVTTKDRMNRYGPARIGSEKGVWYITVNGWESKVPFADGCIVKGARIKGAGTARDEKRTNRLRASVRAYAKAFIDAMDAGKVPAPSGGDCWLCSLFPEKSPGQDADHYESHIREKYYVPALLAKIVKARVGISIAAHDWVASVWNPNQENADAARRLYGGIAKDQLRKALTKRLYRELGV